MFFVFSADTHYYCQKCYDNERTLSVCSGLSQDHTRTLPVSSALATQYPEGENLATVTFIAHGVMHRDVVKVVSQVVVVVVVVIRVLYRVVVAMVDQAIRGILQRSHHH